jgi:hypothetical protein
MQSSDQFTKTINAYLSKVASNDSLFAESFKKPEKNIKDCVTYILNTVKNSGCMGFDDSEIYGMAMHYYDEDGIKVGSTVSCKVVVNHTVSVPQPSPENTSHQALSSKKKLVQKEEIINQTSLF